MPTTLEATIGEIVTSDDHRVLLVGDPGPDVGWVRLDDVDDAVIDEWFAVTLAEIPNGARDVAGSYLASFVGDAITMPVARALDRCNRGILLQPDTTWVRQHAEGWFDGVALGSESLVLARGAAFDEAAAANDAADQASVAADDAAMRRLVVEHLREVLVPIFAAVRARSPYGLRGMWGAVADSVASDATWTAHVNGRDVVSAWQRAQTLLDALATAAPVAVTRPTLARVEADGHVAHLTIRGTCCLYYKSVDPDPAAPAAGVEYCTSCPLGTDEVRLDRRRAWLQRDLAVRS